jgi:hypothetical protein
VTTADRDRLGEGTNGSLSQQIGDVVNPIAQRCSGWPDAVIRPILRRSWHQAFDAEIDEQPLTACAAAIHYRQPWTPAFGRSG